VLLAQMLDLAFAASDGYRDTLGYQRAASR
jgi:hypothetical protein